MLSYSIDASEGFVLNILGAIIKMCFFYVKVSLGTFSFLPKIFIHIGFPTNFASNILMREFDMDN